MGIFGKSPRDFNGNTGWFDKLIQHQDANCPRGVDIEEAWQTDEGGIEYVINDHGERKPYSISREEAQQVYRNWEQHPPKRWKLW